ncbi:MAG TPA: DNA polymerase [Pseudoneobacillus sp.]|nr:DNA polymerase [Pseudoneobacillus sp.]
MSIFTKWQKQHIETHEDLLKMKELFEQDKPIISGGDTETTGLHIMKDKAFLIVFGWIAKGVEGGRVFTFYPTQKNMTLFFKLAKKTQYFFWWNTKYDLHMMTNIGYRYDYPNLAEGMALARLTLESKPARDGGDSLKLKAIGNKYVDQNSDKEQEKVQLDKERLEKERIKILAIALKQFPMDGETTATGRQKFWGKGAIERFLKDPTNDLEDLPSDVRETWLDWQSEYPEITYADIDRQLMIKYAAHDVIIMLEFVKKSWKVMLHKKQLEVFQAENRNILPLYRMERVGMKVDREYLEQSRLRVKAYIQKLRTEMYNLIGDRVNSGQHDEIKRIFKTKWNITLDSADKPALKSVTKNFTGDPKRYAQLIGNLRTLEKWYSTYIVRVLKIAELDGRAYTQIHQVSAVSGRVGSDFQQFPKKPLKDENGEILFHPRKCFIVTGNGYSKIYYLDYSQIELRVQANYTLKVSGGDLNLCRAYMPFKCKHDLTGEMFDPYNKQHLKDWDSGHWLDEEGQPWTATDVHGATTQNAFPNLEVGSDEFKVMRSKGKMVNFLKNYGGSIAAILSQLDDIDFETAKRLDEGYYNAFPDVKIYQQTVIEQHARKGFVANEYGMRYYISDHRDSYKLCNYLVQGTAAMMLKQKICEADALLLDHKSRFQMNIHDEMSFEIWDGEEFLIPKLKAIMEEFEWVNVPIVADLEVTTTTWADKYEIESEELLTA